MLRKTWRVITTWRTIPLRIRGYLRGFHPPFITRSTRSLGDNNDHHISPWLLTTETSVLGAHPRSGINPCKLGEKNRLTNKRITNHESHFRYQVPGSTISTLLDDKINPKDCQVLSLGDSGFLQFFWVVSSDYGKPRVHMFAWLYPESKRMWPYGAFCERFCSIKDTKRKVVLWSHPLKFFTVPPQTTDTWKVNMEPKMISFWKSWCSGFMFKFR